MHGKNTRVFGGVRDLSTLFMNSSLSSPIDMADNTTYGSEGKTYEPGLDDGQITFEYPQSATARSWLGDWRLPYHAINLHYPVGQRFVGGCDVGAPADLWHGPIQSEDIPAPVGDIVKTSMTIQVIGGVGRGVCLGEMVAVATTSGNFASIDQGAASANGARAAWTLTGAGGTSLDTIVQHSTDDSIWVDLITFDSFGNHSEMQWVEGTVNRYIRLAWANGVGIASVDAVVSFERL